MNEEERKVLEFLKEIPLDKEPFRILADKLGMAEDELLKKIEAIIEKGFIREIGPFFDYRKLGFSGTLCAASVASEDILSFSKVLDEIEGITHNYEREHTYNIWFTLVAESEERVREIIEFIEKKTGYKILSFPVKRMFKLDTKFKII